MGVKPEGTSRLSEKDTSLGRRSNAAPQARKQVIGFIKTLLRCAIPKVKGGIGFLDRQSFADAIARDTEVRSRPALTPATLPDVVADFLLWGQRESPDEDDGEEEQRCPPSEKASHGCKSCVVATGASATLSTSEVLSQGLTCAIVSCGGS